MDALLLMAASIALVVGWFFVILGIEHLMLFLSTSAWVTVPAIVEQVDTQSAGRRGSRRVTASYRYVYEGRAYTGTRVGLARGGDNFSSWTDQTYARLAAARDSGKPVECYVSPSDPGQAVLDRALRPGVLLFGLGLGFPFAALGTLLWIAFTLAAVSKVRSQLRSRIGSPTGVGR